MALPPVNEPSDLVGIRLFDSASGTVRPLARRDPGQVSMYVCGPTVYDVPHLGHGRFSLVFDVLRRYLQFSGMSVRYVSNITDVDDKILERAAREGRAPGAVAEEFEEVWWQAMDSLGVARPDESPHATDWVPAMVAMVGELVDRGIAYETDDGVYLDVGQIPSYGLLALQSLASMRAGARVGTVEGKRSPHDFALWKKATDALAWSSPWGTGRPGWHTECVVMSLGLLGDGFDLHGGGQDLRFPHHENERAQAVALGRAFAQHWVHNGFVEVEGEKMSKSLGNFTSLTDLLARADARAYRLLVLRAHYRRGIEVSGATVADAEEGLGRLDGLARRFPEACARGAEVTTARDAAALGGSAEVAGFTERMDDDLDTPGALAGVFDLVRQAHSAADAGQQVEAERLASTVVALCGALGLRLRSGSGDVFDADTAALLAARDDARARRDWSRADSVRGELEALGWVVEDSAEGTRLRRP